MWPGREFEERDREVKASRLNSEELQQLQGGDGQEERGGAEGEGTQDSEKRGS